MGISFRKEVLNGCFPSVCHPSVHKFKQKAQSASQKLHLSNILNARLVLTVECFLPSGIAALTLSTSSSTGINIFSSLCSHGLANTDATTYAVCTPRRPVLLKYHQSCSYSSINRKRLLHKVDFLVSKNSQCPCKYNHSWLSDRWCSHKPLLVSEREEGLSEAVGGHDRQVWGNGLNSKRWAAHSGISFTERHPRRHTLNRTLKNVFT